MIGKDEIKVIGAREHNLKNINVSMPKNKLVVITGLSGSGKSSLAFDTIYAEGQRRYVESLSSYARQFLQLQEKPDVDEIDGLSPAIAIEQKTISKNPRSTVGTITEIYDYLRLLFARIGVPYSPATGLPIESQTSSQMIKIISEYPKGIKLLILAPIVRGQKGEYRKELLDLRKQGFLRVKIDGEIYNLDDAPTLDRNKKHNIEVVVDRLVTSPDLGNRLADSVETALKLSKGILMVEIAGFTIDYEEERNDLEEGKIITFSELFACPVSGFQISEIEPRIFSFNSPYGACPKCDGLGKELFFDPDLIVPNQKLSLKNGAIEVWDLDRNKYYMQVLEGLAQHFKFHLEDSYLDLPKDIKDIILYGSSAPITFTFYDGMRKNQTTQVFEGVINLLEKQYIKTDSVSHQEELAKYRSTRKCKVCNGYRLKTETLTIRVHGKHIGEVSDLTITNALDWFSNLHKFLTTKQNEIAVRILKELKDRLTFLVNVGLEYLTLSRESSTLSGGESQRIRLASQIGSKLSGVLYVLDEPSIGLHQSDNTKLIQTLKSLRDLGNTVIVVEHDEETMKEADYIIDVGPGAGIHGGQIVAAGTAKEVEDNPNSITGQYLKGVKYIAVPENRRVARNNQYIKLYGAKANNLKNVDIQIPIGTFTCITGVSGGGKSSLIIDTLYPAMLQELENSKVTPGPFDKLEGVNLIDKIIEIDQSPIGRTPRSNPATYTGAFTPIRDWFVNLPESKARGYKPGRFSFNVKGGRCENCQGDGIIKIEMHFLPDVYVNCEVCHGKRYNKETLEVKYKDKSISDILDMTVEEAYSFFSHSIAISEKMKALLEVGLSYISIGQSATTLSGGEAQRIKLAKELAKKSTGKTLYILDEPTTGLHVDDVNKLLTVLHTLVEKGNTVVVIEHNLDVIKTADHIIDIGPGGGDKGGRLVASCTPEELCKIEESLTGQYLKPLL